MTGHFFITGTDTHTFSFDMATATIPQKQIWLGTSVDGHDIIHLADDICGLSLIVAAWDTHDERNDFMNALMHSRSMNFVRGIRAESVLHFDTQNPEETLAALAKTEKERTFGLHLD